MFQSTAFFLTCACLLEIGTAAIRIETDSISGAGASLFYSADVDGADLVNAGQSTLAGVLTTPTFPGSGTDFQAGNLNDGAYLDGDAHITYFDPSRLPATVTFELDLSTNTSGYDLTRIGSFMGSGFESRIQCHQIYSIEVSQVGSAAFTPLTSVNYSPFADGDFENPYESRVIISEDSTGILASGIDGIRFTFSDPGGTPGTYERGTVIRELDVVGHPTGSTTGLVTANSPVPRQIVQRNASNVGDIPISGSYTGLADEIQARAVVMNNPNDSGVSTDWQTIDASPSSGSFSGILFGVAAGGWYQIEFRALNADTPSVTTAVSRVGVGDIYLIAGQSNAANFGEPALDPADDRISARTLPLGNSWIRLADPLPSFDPSRAGSGGSPWPRLGALLTASENVPVGFLSLGIGNTHVQEWLSPNLFYLTRIRDSIRSFPINGFKAILWHQGERDANISTSYSDYKSRLESVIYASRHEPGFTWNIPWYIAEASDQNSSTLSQEEPIKAAQRSVAFDDPYTFLGPSTDEFHLENASPGKMATDNIHFNEQGLTDHAMQWLAILQRTTTPIIENAGFENNTTPSITTVPALAENATASTNITAGTSPSVLDWRILSANGQAAADGSNGYFNPGTATYGTASPANMEGTHAALLTEGTAGNQFVQATRYLARSNASYVATIAFGLRNSGTGVFGNARIDILAGNALLASHTVLAEDLIAGQFTDVTLSALAAPVYAGEELNIRIAKINGGADTYVDFDNIRIIESLPTPYEDWALTNGISDPTADTDGDKLPNLLEFALGFDPNNSNHPIAPFNEQAGALRITRRIAALSGLNYTIETSSTLAPGSWSEVTEIITTPVSSEGSFETVDLTIPAGWDNAPLVFYRLSTELVP